jgi:hypothetical protein
MLDMDHLWLHEVSVMVSPLLNVPLRDGALSVGNGQNAVQMVQEAGKNWLTTNGLVHKQYLNCKIWQKPKAMYPR